METDTIAAIATAMTNSGIGIIRISGGNAIGTADRIIRLKEKNKKISECPTHTLHYGFVEDCGKIVDEVIVLLMRAPKSYTREDTVEIDCHGGILVMNRILDLLFRNGARPAEPGEFTKRAFLNGRIDLIQAESVIDVINAKNDFALKSSMDQLEGFLSLEVKSIRKEILHEIALIESSLDDPEHYNIDGYCFHLLEKIDSLIVQIENLLRNAENGSVLKEGVQTVIVGKPNSGKSSLLNILSGKQKAIVTDIAGTTRDAIEEQILMNGISLNVVDTAGIRFTDDVVEKLGVDKSKEYIEHSDLILYVVDATCDLDSNDMEIIDRIQNRNVIVLLNKSDLLPKICKDDIRPYLDQTIISISAKRGDGMDELPHVIEDIFFHGKVSVNDEIFITNSRHKVSLQKTRDSLLLVKKSIENGMPEDFYSIDLMNAYEELGKMIGEEVNDDLINEIFSQFCMGK